MNRCGTIIFRKRQRWRSRGLSLPRISLALGVAQLEQDELGLGRAEVFSA